MTQEMTSSRRIQRLILTYSIHLSIIFFILNALLLEFHNRARIIYDACHHPPVAHGIGEEGDRLMLGIEDPWILLGYAVMIVSAAACIVYGWLKRNSEED